MIDRFKGKGLHLILSILAIGVWVLIAMHFFMRHEGDSVSEGDRRFDRFAVQAIDIVDPDGTVRMTIANRSHFPPVRYRGKDYERSIDDTVGLVFYEANGDEAGGLVQTRLGDRNQSAIILDYTHQITDGIGLIKQESSDGERWRAGMFISDRRPLQQGDVTSSQGVERILLSSNDGDAALVISDPAGNPRIRIGVDREGVPFMHMLDEDGKLTNRGPVEQ